VAEVTAWLRQAAAPRCVYRLEPAVPGAVTQHRRRRLGPVVPTQPEHRVGEHGRAAPAGYSLAILPWGQAAGYELACPAAVRRRLAVIASHSDRNKMTIPSRACSPPIHLLFSPAAASEV